MNNNGFSVIGAEAITTWLSNNVEKLPNIVSDVYLQHAKGRTNNPDSYFLRFPGDTSNRIIALPCSLEDDQPVSGVKWIASFPENIHKGLDRASAVIVVNDRSTGYPMALLEGSQISIARTAASATLGAMHLHPSGKTVENLAVVGCGPIASATISQMLSTGFSIKKLTAIDLNRSRAEKFLSRFQASINQCDIGSGISEIASSDLVLFATSAGVPYVSDHALLAHNPTVLHISLRDIDPALIAVSQNITDDTSHCLKANTSLHLAVTQLESTSFIAGTIADVVLQKISANPKMPRIYSPFGMGILDLAIAREILCDESKHGHVLIDNFLPTAYVA